MLAVIPEVILMDYFNARVRKDHVTWKNIVGEKELAYMNSNGQQLLIMHKI